jgi:hypothetical protein
MEVIGRRKVGKRDARLQEGQSVITSVSRSDAIRHCERTRAMAEPTANPERHKTARRWRQEGSQTQKGHLRTRRGGEPASDDVGRGILRAAAALRKREMPHEMISTRQYNTGQMHSTQPAQQSRREPCLLQGRGSRTAENEQNKPRSTVDDNSA